MNAKELGLTDDMKVFYLYKYRKPELKKELEKFYKFLEDESFVPNNYQKYISKMMDNQCGKYPYAIIIRERNISDDGSLTRYRYSWSYCYDGGHRDCRTGIKKCDKWDKNIGLKIALGRLHDDASIIEMVKTLNNEHISSYRLTIERLHEDFKKIPKSIVKFIKDDIFKLKMRPSIIKVDI